MEASVGIVAQRTNERARGLAATLVEELERDHGERAVVDESTGEAVDARAVPVGEMDSCDLVVSIGGDGTLLFVAREVGDTPLVGVNLGEVGFLNAVAPADAVAVVTALVADLGTGSLDARELARLRATGIDEEWSLEPALNEVLVHGPRRGHGGGATVEISVDGERYVECHADGALVSTPTGSTAYNLSEGGPLIHPDADALVVTGMAGRGAPSPLVVDPDAELTLSVTDAETAYAIADGRNRRRLDPPAAVSVSLADDPIRLVGPRTPFFDALEKLD